MDDWQASDHGGGEDLTALFRHASRLMARLSHRHQHGSHAQQHVLQLIRQKGPLPQKELMALLGVRSASLSEVLAKLEQRGLIARRRSEQDRRGFIVTAQKEEGEVLAKPQPEETGQPVSSFFSCLDADEQARLAEMLRKIIAAMESDGPHEKGGQRRGRRQHRPRGRKGPR